MVEVREVAAAVRRAQAEAGIADRQPMSITFRSKARC